MKNKLPLDSPIHRLRPRIYIALSNHCNRKCPWCCTYSSPEKNTFLSKAAFLHILNSLEEPTDLQLEGGEPFTHPDFFDFVDKARSQPLVHTLIINTNMLLFPTEYSESIKVLERLQSPLCIKASFNHYLCQKDPLLLQRLLPLASYAKENSSFQFIINLRRRKGVNKDDLFFKKILEENQLLPFTNDFFLQSYGRAKNKKEWNRPHIVKSGFKMYNPDGSLFVDDLVKRSEAMGALK